MSKFFKGVYTAQITPFKNNKIDFKSLEKMLKRQANAGIDGVVIAGSTGESTSLSLEEYKELLEFSVNILTGNTQIIAGLSSANLDEASAKSEIATNSGVDGIMLTTPYYCKPTQSGIYEYFKYIHDQTNVPIMTYAVPSRAGVDISDETLIRLSKLERILSIKDATSDITKPLRLSQISHEFTFLTGDDPNICSYAANGGSGVVSVLSNIIPEQIALIQKYIDENNFFKAFDIHKNIISLTNLLFKESNPILVKYACSLLGLCEYELRLPLVQTTDINTQNAIKQKLLDLEEIEE